MKEIKTDNLSEYGIEIKSHIMDNGEKRFRMIGKDGSGYIRTESLDGGWQKAHYHEKIQELYLVQKRKSYSFRTSRKWSKIHWL